MATAAATPAPALKSVAGLPPPDLSLPVLEPVKSREQYRERPEAETEEVSSSARWLETATARTADRQLCQLQSCMHQEPQQQAGSRNDAQQTSSHSSYASRDQIHHDPTFALINVQLSVACALTC